MRSLLPRPRSGLRAVLTVLLLAFPACDSQPRYAPPPRSGTDIVLRISSMPLEQPVFYTVTVGSRPVSFFVVRLNDGVHAYFDACVSCYQQKRGYVHQDGQVVCRACNMEFPVYKLEKGIGGCYPIKLRGRTEQDAYIIPLSLIEAESGRF